MTEVGRNMTLSLSQPELLDPAGRILQEMADRTRAQFIETVRGAFGPFVYPISRLVREQRLAVRHVRLGRVRPGSAIVVHPAVQAGWGVRPPWESNNGSNRDAR